MSKSENAKSLEERAAAAPTELHERFAQWIYEQTGVRPDTKSVQLACIFRMEFQSSPENQAALRDRKAEAARRKKEAAARKKAALEKKLAALKAELEKADSEPTAVETPAEKPAPAKKAPARKAVAAKATDKPARTPRTRKATAPKVTPDVGNDFDKDDLEERPEPVKRARRPRRTAATKTA